MYGDTCPHQSIVRQLVHRTFEIIVELCQMAKLEAYLAYLRCKDPHRDIPVQIRGEVTTSVAQRCFHLTCSNGLESLIFAGRDAHSCTSTTAAVAHWLSPDPTGAARTLSDIKHQAGARAVALGCLASDQAVADLIGQGGTKLMVFSTAPHKFAVLCVENEPPALLHSNQDDTRGGHRFLLQEHLASNGFGASGLLYMTHEQLTEMIRQLGAATIGTADHAAVFQAYFGSPFARGNSDDYWVVVLPVTVDLDA